MYDVEGELEDFELIGEAYYYEKDLLNSVIGIYNTKGERVVSYKYNSFGKIMSVEGDTSLAVINPFRYRGYFYDEETGLYYLNSRYYDCETGRFINADSYEILFRENSGDIREGNLFAYCYDNFVMYADYSGNYTSPPKTSNVSYEYGPSNSRSNSSKINSATISLRSYGSQYGNKKVTSASIKFDKQNNTNT